MSSPLIVITSYNLDDTQKHLCREALQQAGTIKGAAKLLGISPGVLRRLMVKFELPVPHERGHRIV